MGVELDMSSLGRLIASARKGKEWSQKELASKILKEDGQAITPQYLNDIEHDRRSPSSDHLIEQFAKALSISASTIYGVNGVLPQKDVKLVRNTTPDKVAEAFVAFRRTLKD